MTERIDPELKNSFASSASAREANPLKAELATSGGPSIEALVAAILDKKQVLSAEDLVIFESLLDDPTLEPKQRQDFLQTIWNIVVCIIDYQWDNRLSSPKPEVNICDERANTDKNLLDGGDNMVQSRDEELFQNYSKADKELHSEDGP